MPYLIIPIQWFSVADKLPPYNIPVMFTVDYEEEYPDLIIWWGKRSKNGWWGNNADSDGWQRISDVVTHWGYTPSSMPKIQEKKQWVK